MGENVAMVNDQGMRRAAALMADWIESEEDGDTWFAVQLASQDLAVAVVNDTLLDESITVITGLMALAGRLLNELARDSGKSVSEILEVAGEQAVD